MCPHDTSSESTPPTEHRPPRLRKIPPAARYFHVTERTMQNWLSQGYITGYRVGGARELLVDLDDVERALMRHPRSKMRDGRRPYGYKSRVVSVPVVVTAAQPQDDE